MDSSDASVMVRKYYFLESLGFGDLCEITENIHSIGELKHDW